MSGNSDDAGRIDGPGELATSAHQGLQCLGCFIVGDDEDGGLAGCARHERQIESTRGRCEPGDTPPTRIQAEVPTNALKGRRMLQFRKKLADKRENHAISSVAVCGSFRFCAAALLSFFFEDHRVAAARRGACHLFEL